MTKKKGAILFFSFFLSFSLFLLPTQPYNMAKSKKRHAQKNNGSRTPAAIAATANQRQQATNNGGQTSSFQPLNMFFGGSRNAGYQAIPSTVRPPPIPCTQQVN